MTKTILQLGSLEVVSQESEDVPHAAHKFYWKDKHTDATQGPFDSVYQAMKDYEKVVKAFKMADILPLRKGSN